MFRVFIIVFIDKEILKKETKQLIVQTIFNVINFTFVLLILALAFISIFNKELILRILDWFGVFIDSIWSFNYFIAFASSLIEAFPVLWVVVPGQNIMLLVAIFFAKKTWLNLIGVYILAILWAIAWNYIGYFLWKKYWDSFFDKYWVWFWVGKTEVKYLKQWIDKWWAIWITFAKFHNVTRAFLPFIAGSMWMKNKAFMFYNVLGSILRAVTIITIWVIFGNYYETIIEYIGTIMIVFILIMFWYVYFFKKDWLKTYIKEKNEELDNL